MAEPGRDARRPPPRRGSRPERASRRARRSSGATCPLARPLPAGGGASLSAEKQGARGHGLGRTKPSEHLFHVDRAREREIAVPADPSEALPRPGPTPEGVDQHRRIEQHGAHVRPLPDRAWCRSAARTPPRPRGRRPTRVLRRGSSRVPTQTSSQRRSSSSARSTAEATERRPGRRGPNTAVELADERVVERNVHIVCVEHSTLEKNSVRGCRRSPTTRGSSSSSGLPRSTGSSG